MTDPLHNRTAPNIEDVVCAWMQPVMRTAVERGLDDTLPFCEVTRISGADDCTAETDDPVVQLDFYAHGAAEAATAAEVGHRRMLRLLRECPTIELPDGSTADIDWGETLIKPFPMAYAHDKIRRYTARYQLATSYVTVDS